MILDKFGLKSLFHEMIRLAVEDMRAPQSESARMGFGCKKLMDDMCLRQDALLNRIMGDYSTDSHEYRLNEAGLKMLWRMNRDDKDNPRFLCVICGDQVDYYKVLTEQLRSLIRQRGACKWTYDKKRR
jgi:hypothetical protein